MADANKKAAAAAVDAAMAQAEADDDGPARGKRSRLATAQGDNYKPVKTNQATINIIMLKALLQTMQNIRDLLANVWQYTITKKSALVVKIKLLVRTTIPKSKKRKRGMDLVPHVYGPLQRYSRRLWILAPKNR